VPAAAADEEVVMRSNSGPAAARASRTASPDRAARPAGGGRPVDADRLAALLEPAVTALGLDLEGVRVTSAGRRRLLRVTVDGDGGISLDDIEKVSRELSGVLETAAAMGEMPYTLEVSSPGVDRPLTEPRHWRRAAGRLVSVEVTQERPEGGSGGSASIRGRIKQADARGVTLEIDGDARQFSYAELGPGRIQIEFGRLDEPDDGADEGTDEEEPDGY
jgi:ribosome maturation factor RimP